MAIYNRASICSPESKSGAASLSMACCRCPPPVGNGGGGSPRWRQRGQRRAKPLPRSDSATVAAVRLSRTGSGNTAATQGARRDVARCVFRRARNRDRSDLWPSTHRQRRHRCRSLNQARNQPRQSQDRTHSRRPTQNHRTQTSQAEKPVRRGGRPGAVYRRRRADDGTRSLTAGWAGEGRGVPPTSNCGRRRVTWTCDRPALATASRLRAALR